MRLHHINLLEQTAHEIGQYVQVMASRKLESEKIKATIIIVLVNISLQLVWASELTELVILWIQEHSLDFGDLNRDIE